jgi:PucR C-terminal helix-turn-helix domain/GGDEF-like domain
LVYDPAMPLTDEASITTATRQVATALVPDLVAIGEGMLSRIAVAMPELVSSGALEVARASCHANCKALLYGLIRDLPVAEMAATQEVIQPTRALVHYALNIDNFVRAYRIATSYWCKRWAEAVEQHCSDTSLAIRVVSHGTEFVLSWLDVITEQLHVEFRDEAERLGREGSLAWTAYIRRALAEKDLDVPATSLRLGYALGGHHIAFVISHHHDKDDVPLDSIARTLAGALTSAKPLVVRVDLSTAWCWVPTHHHERKLPALHAAVLVGQGRPASGLDGFRRSHREACDALRVARLSGYPAGTVTSFDRVELAALCSTDPDYCRAFIAEKLGPLAADTEETRSLRATLRVFFQHDSSYRASAAHLGLHHNTIRYRIEQVETMLGRPPGEQRLHLELALHLAALLRSTPEVTRCANEASAASVPHSTPADRRN